MAVIIQGGGYISGILLVITVKVLKKTLSDIRKFTICIWYSAADNGQQSCKLILVYKHIFSFSIQTSQHGYMRTANTLSSNTT